MAKAAPHVETPPLTPAEPPDEEFEIVLPQATDAEGDEEPLRLEEEGPEASPSEPKKSAEAEPKPKAPQVAAKAEDEVAKDAVDREGLVARAREERTKRKQYARRYQDTLTELDRAREQLAQERAKVKDEGDPAAERYWAGRVAELKTKADNAGGMGELVEMTLNEVWREQERRERVMGRRLAQMEYVTQVALGNVNSRLVHSDYDTVLRESGVQDAIGVQPDGQWKDPVLARAIYFTADGKLRADPAERAYEVAEALLRGKDAYDKELEGEGEAPVPIKKKPAPTQSAATAEAEAERRGAQRVIEKVEAAARRPVGIRSIRPAATPGRGVVTFRELDRLADDDPARLEQILRSNPDLERRWLGG